MEQDVWISIGKLAQLSGVPVESLRTWERRYGVPVAERLPSGHRRYAMGQVERLRLCRAATDAGFRPGDVLPLSLDALHATLAAGGIDSAHTAGKNSAALLDETAPPRTVPAASAAARAGRNLGQVGEARGHDEAGVLIGQWLGAARAYKLDAMAASMAAAWQRRGAVRFADELAGPWLDALGCAWAAGDVSVAQEHAASERLRELCASQWRGLIAQGGAPTLVLSTLPGEHHQLGLQLVAACAAVTGAAIVYLGADTPLDDIARCAAQASADAVAVSVSRFADPAATRANLERLRARLDPGVVLLCGGTGAPLDLDGGRHLPSFAALRGWIETWQQAGRSAAAEGIER